MDLLVDTSSTASSQVSLSRYLRTPPPWTCSWTRRPQPPHRLVSPDTRERCHHGPARRHVVHSLLTGQSLSRYPRTPPPWTCPWTRRPQPPHRSVSLQIPENAATMDLLVDTSSTASSQVSLSRYPRTPPPWTCSWTRRPQPPHRLVSLQIPENAATMDPLVDTSSTASSQVSRYTTSVIFILQIGEYRSLYLRSSLCVLGRPVAIGGDVWSE